MNMPSSKIRNVFLVFAVLGISCLMAGPAENENRGSIDPRLADVLQGDITTVDPANDTTTKPTTPPTTSTTVTPDTTTDSNKNTTTPSTTTTSTTTTSTTPATTSTTPAQNTTTSVPTPTPSPTPSPSPTTSTTVAPPTPHCRHFDGYSFVGGMILAYGSLAIGLVLWKFYKARTERNYHTL
ncbi:uncharacterized protein LOC131436391 [Malaya genurostris]|uniref:uncharacterized protein LOC131436391 n=1 Tax=Malaya genurostris TaxID=325434 RepID=UPI0026F3FE76|nr:uncharacterized protein LOC131436391 [Malaya genurostris]